MNAGALLNRARPLVHPQAHEIQPCGHLVTLPIALPEEACKKRVEIHTQLLADTITLRDLHTQRDVIRGNALQVCLLRRTWPTFRSRKRAKRVDTETHNMRHHLFAASAIVGTALLAFSTASAAPFNDKLSIPAGFDHWYLVNSMIVTKDSPLFDAIGGLHHIYVNSVGLPRLKMGGSAPYPDGTIFVDDVRDFSLADGSFRQGSRKAIPVMLKDAKTYASTGGWGFQAWAGGDPHKPLVTDPVKTCFACHMPQKSNDYTFSTYLH